MLAEAVERARWGLRRRIGWQPYPATEAVACMLCGSREGEVVGRRMQFAMRYTTLLCGGCGLVYTSPRPSESSYESFYEGPYHRLYGFTGVDTEPTERGRAVADYLASSVDLQGHSGLFDIGCGGGGLLRAIARDMRFRHMSVGGCDPGWPADPEVQESGVRIAVHPCRIDAVYDAVAQYSLFVMYDVIEHLLEPRAFLRALHEHAPPGSELFVSTSCLDNWREVPPAGWEPYYLRLAHPYTFTEKTLAATLADAGWRVRDRCAAAKGDQWVVASRSDPDPASFRSLGGHSGEVRAMIEAYGSRSA